jgi:phage terminase large subunit-like protein
MTTFSQKTLMRWRRNPISFIQQCLRDSETGKPFKLLDAERRFLAHAFQLSNDGRLLYPEQVYSCPKKSGKTTFAAIHALTMMLLFGGRYPEVTICANDLEQACGRVFEMIKRIVECSPLLRADAKITQTRIEFRALNATIQAIGSDYAGAAGGNHCIAVFDELWAYSTERSHRLWDELVPPPTRKISCRLTVTYAGFAGESTVLETLYQRGLQQPLVAPDLHAGDGILMFWSHTPIAPWQDEAWLAEMRRSLRPNAYLRMIENRFVTTESTFIDMAWWDACVDPQAAPIIANRVLPVWIGVDTSVKRDSTAIVAVHWDGKAQKARLVWHRIYQPLPDQPIDFEVAIEDTIRDLHKRYRVCGVWYDPYQMQASAQRLRREGVLIEAFPQSAPNLTEASQNLYELIKGRNLVAYPDAAVRLAVSRAVAVETARGWRIAKDKQSHKIDVVVALGMAALAAVRSESAYNWEWVDDIGGEVPEQFTGRRLLPWGGMPLIFRG